ncbi:MAG: hypothetical protein AAFX90_19595 [Pseudomonadota bacterium]
MSNLKTLGLTPSHLSAPAQHLVLAIQGNSCAWEIRGGWRPKNRNARDFKRATGIALVNRELAQVLYKDGTTRLVLTAAGEEMAKELEALKQKSRSAA